MKHIKRDHKEAFYKTTNGKFIIALHKDGDKELYSQELSFRELISNEDINFRILPKPN